MSILTLPAPVVNFDFAVIAPEAEEYRPTAGPDFYPTADEEAEASELLNDPEPSDAQWEEWAEDAFAMDRVCSGPIL